MDVQIASLTGHTGSNAREIASWVEYRKFHVIMSKTQHCGYLVYHHCSECWIPNSMILARGHSMLLQVQDRLLSCLVRYTSTYETVIMMLVGSCQMTVLF